MDTSGFGELSASRNQVDQISFVHLKGNDGGAETALMRRCGCADDFHKRANRMEFNRWLQAKCLLAQCFRE
jgi:hypothetical protein